MHNNPVNPLVFVVDDEPELLENYEALLGEQFQVKCFSSSAAFIDNFEAKNSTMPDLVITDLMMPGMTGLDMIRHVQLKNAFFPFILLSGYLEKQSMIDALQLGAFRLLEKPIEMDSLLQVMDELLLEHQAIQVRRELRSLNSQVSEIYNVLRMVADQYVPADVKDRFFTTADKGRVTGKQSFDAVLDELEIKQKKLKESEKILDQMRTPRFRGFMKKDG